MQLSPSHSRRISDDGVGAAKPHHLPKGRPAPARSVMHRLSVEHTVLPSMKMPLFQAVLTSPLKFGAIGGTLCDVSRRSPVAAVATTTEGQGQASEFNRPLDVTTAVASRTRVLPWPSLPRESSIAPHASLAEEAGHRMYDLSRVNVPGKASLAEAAALSPTQRPWTAPAYGPPTRLSRFRDRHPQSPTSHLAPGCYGVELDRPDAPRPQAARWTDVTDRFPEPAAAACVGSHSPGLPPHQTTQRFQDVPAMRSSVPRFAPYRDLGDPALRATLSSLPLPDDRGNLSELAARSPLRYSEVFRSTAVRDAASPRHRDSNGGRHGVLNDFGSPLLGALLEHQAKAAAAAAAACTAAVSAASLLPRLPAALHGAGGVRPLSSMVSATPAHSTIGAAPRVLAERAHLGPGTYTDGTVAGLRALRPRTAGEAVLPLARTPRFADKLPAYKLLASGARLDDSYLGHRPRSTSASALLRINRRPEAGHEGYWVQLRRGRTALPECEYFLDRPGSSCASMAVNMTANPRSYHVMRRAASTAPSQALVRGLLRSASAGALVRGAAQQQRPAAPAEAGPEACCCSKPQRCASTVAGVGLTRFASDGLLAVQAGVQQQAPMFRAAPRSSVTPLQRFEAPASPTSAAPRACRETYFSQLEDAVTLETLAAPALAAVPSAAPIDAACSKCTVQVRDPARPSHFLYSAAGAARGLTLEQEGQLLAERSALRERQLEQLKHDRRSRLHLRQQSGGLFRTSAIPHPTSAAVSPKPLPSPLRALAPHALGFHSLPRLAPAGSPAHGCGSPVDRSADGGAVGSEARAAQAESKRVLRSLGSFHRLLERTDPKRIAAKLGLTLDPPSPQGRLTASGSSRPADSS